MLVSCVAWPLEQFRGSPEHPGREVLSNPSRQAILCAGGSAHHGSGPPAPRLPPERPPPPPAPPGAPALLTRLLAGEEVVVLFPLIYEGVNNPDPDPWSCAAVGRVNLNFHLWICNSLLIYIPGKPVKRESPAWWRGLVRFCSGRWVGSPLCLVLPHCAWSRPGVSGSGSEISRRAWIGLSPIMDWPSADNGLVQFGQF